MDNNRPTARGSRSIERFIDRHHQSIVDRSRGHSHPCISATHPTLHTRAPDRPSRLMQTKTIKASADSIQVAPSGGTRPVGHFGVAQGSVRAWAFTVSVSVCVRALRCMCPGTRPAPPSASRKKLSHTPRAPRFSILCTHLHAHKPVPGGHAGHVQGGRQVRKDKVDGHHDGYRRGYHPL
jgi:hypothetical protein